MRNRYGGNPVSTTQIATIAPPPRKPKASFPEKKICYGTFREDFWEEKKEECHSCWMYIDCIQLSFKNQRKHRLEIQRLVAILRRRIETLSPGSKSSAA